MYFLLTSIMVKRKFAWSAICKLCSSFGTHHYRSTAPRHLVPKERGLEIVIITEEETGTPWRCEMVAATDTKAPWASV